MRPGRAFKLVRALDIVVKLGKEVMTSRVRASSDLQGTIDLQSWATFGKDAQHTAVYTIAVKCHWGRVCAIFMILRICSHYRLTDIVSMIDLKLERKRVI